MLKNLLISCLFALPTLAQSFYDWESYTVDEFYERIYLEYGTLDQNGDPIDYIYVIKDVEPGIYEIEITDGDGDLYEVRGTDLFIEFTTYFGYAGYSEEGVLEVNQNSYSTFYRKEY